MENKRKYPTQDDCQMLIDAMNQPSINTGTCSPDFKEFGHKLNERPMKGEKCLMNVLG